MEEHKITLARGSGRLDGERTIVVERRRRSAAWVLMR